MIPRPASILIALVTPLVLVTVGVLVLGGSTATLFGIPVIVVFMFAMFPLTSVLMWISWRMFDRHSDYQLDEVDPTNAQVTQ